MGRLEHESPVVMFGGDSLFPSPTDWVLSVSEGDDEDVSFLVATCISSYIFEYSDFSHLWRSAAFWSFGWHA